MKSRASAAVQAESTRSVVSQPQREKNDRLLQRYLGAALFAALGGRKGNRPTSDATKD